MQTVNSNYDTDTWGIQTALAKSIGRHDLSAGFNASTTKTQRPFSQSPIPSVYSEIMQPEADSRGYTLGGFVQDKINFDLDSHNFAVIPACAWCINRPNRKISAICHQQQRADRFDVSNLYGKNAIPRCCRR
jgi:hemoglobin/transferrin/lactoferrin receptor protein